MIIGRAYAFGKKRETLIRETYNGYGMSLPKGKRRISIFLVERMKSIGIGKAVAMGMSLNRIFNTSFGEEWVLGGIPENIRIFFIPFCSADPIDKADRFNRKDF